MAQKGTDFTIKFKSIDGGNLPKLKKQIKESTEETEKGEISIGKYVKSLLKAVSVISKLTDLTDTYVTSQRTLNKLFGEGADDLNALTTSLSRMTGISKTSLSSAEASFGQMAISIGMSSELAQEFSEDLTVLTSKLAILKNLDFTTTANAVRQSMKGTVSSTLAGISGITINARTLQQTLNEIGFDGQVSDLNAVNLAMLKYIAISRQVVTNDEELSSVVNQVAWQKKMFSNQVKELTNALGNLLYPILQKILPVLNAILIVITNLINMFASFVSAILGVPKATETVVNATQGFIDYGDAIEGASQKAKKSLRGFDKLNNITTPDPTTYSGGAGVGGVDPTLYAEMQKLDQQMMNIRNRATEIADAIMEWLGFSKDVNGEWKFSKVTLGTVIGALIGGGGIFWAISKILGLFKKFSGIGSIFDLLFGGKDKKSGDKKSIFSIPNPKDILQGVADLAIIVGGLVLLVEAVGLFFSIPYTKDFATTGINQLVEIFTGLGKIALPLAGMSALIVVLGAVTPATVVSGLIGLVAIIGGLELLVLALGALTMIEGFNFLVNAGLQQLGDFFEGLGVALGKLVGGIAEGIASVLPTIGQYLADFSINASPFFENVKNIDESSMNGVKALAETVLILTASAVLDGLTSWFTGGVDFEAFGAMLPDFGKNLKLYADAVKGINGSDVETSANSAKALAELATGLPTMDGKWQKYFGEKNLEAFGETLPSFGKDFAEYAEYVKDIDHEVVQKSADSAESLSKLAKGLPNDGGLWSLFVGENNIADFGKNVASFGKSFKEYYEYISGIDVDKVNAVTEAVDELVWIARTIKDQGIDDTLKKFADNLKKSSNSFNDFFSKTQAYNIGYSFGSSMASGITQALRNTSFPSISLKEGGIFGSTVKTFGITAYADGGFVNSGEVFIANENNKPEYVGKFGNQTAVANNDQIVAGITRGVASGMSVALKNADFGNDQPIYVKAQFGSDEVTDWIRVQEKKRERQYGF